MTPTVVLSKCSHCAVDLQASIRCDVCWQRLCGDCILEHSGIFTCIECAPEMAIRFEGSAFLDPFRLALVEFSAAHGVLMQPPPRKTGALLAIKRNAHVIIGCLAAALAVLPFLLLCLFGGAE